MILVLSPRDRLAITENITGTPPQGTDAKCGFACHTRVKARDYVFTDYGQR